MGQNRRVLGHSLRGAFCINASAGEMHSSVLVVIIRSFVFLGAAAPPAVDMSQAGVPAVVDGSPLVVRSDLSLSGAHGKDYVFHWALHVRVSCIQIYVFSGSLNARWNCAPRACSV